MDGTEERFWKRYAVVVGKVISVSPGETKSKTKLNIEVLKIIASDIDVPKGALSLTYVVGRGSLQLKNFHPKAGDILVMMIENEVHGWRLPSVDITLFESGCTVEKVEGVNDPKLSSVIQKVEEARKCYFSKHKKE